MKGKNVFPSIPTDVEGSFAIGVSAGSPVSG